MKYKKKVIMSLLTINKSLLLIIAVVLINACTKTANIENTRENRPAEAIHFSEQQFKSLGMKVDIIPRKNLSSYVEANGELQVPPQNEAKVTAIIGANVTMIKVIEGDKVQKGEVLAYLSHPDLIQLQMDYLSAWNQAQYIEMEYKRQKRLYEEKVGSGKEFQKVQAEHNSLKGTVKGFEAKFKLMGLNAEEIQKSNMNERIPVTSPINGYIKLVEVKIGQYVQPQTEMFEVVNIDHIHADLMVFEKDMNKVKKGQKVKFNVESSSEKEMVAEIFAVGKAFEQDPKAIHLHAEIENKEGLLIPGMYVRGRIMVDEVMAYALPRDAVVRDGEKNYIFTVEEENIEGEKLWNFRSLEVVVGNDDDGWLEIKPIQVLESDLLVAHNNAYYLLAEMQKGEADHDH